MDLGREVEAGDLGDVGLHVLRPQRRQLDPLAGAEAGEDLGPRFGSRRQRLASGGHHENGRLRELGRHEGQEIERRLVRPVHVLEENHPGRTLAGLQEMPAQLLEHPEAGSEAVGRVGIDRAIQRVRPRNELRQERAHLELQLGRERPLAHGVAEDLHPGPERRRSSALEAAAARHADPEAARDAGELAHAAGLADPGLAGEKAEAAAAAAGAVESAEQPLHRLGAPDEGIARRGRQHGRRHPRRRRRVGLEAEDLRRGRARRASAATCVTSAVKR